MYLTPFCICRTAFKSIVFRRGRVKLTLSRLRDGEMQFSIRQLMLAIAAWCVAYLIAPYATLHVYRISWRHDSAAATIRGIRLFAENELHENPNNQFDEFDFSKLFDEIGGNRDPWGNPYQFAELEHSIEGYKSNVHAYSLGEDGITKTAGNDPDDINSWNYDRRKFYGARLLREERKRYALRTIWLTPLIYLAILMSCRMFGPGKPETTVG